VVDTSLEHHGSAHGTVGDGMNSPAVAGSAGEPAVRSAAHPAVHYNPDAPSEEWGWHGSWRVFAPRGSTILLALGVVMLLLLNFTEHVSHVENYYFNGIALIGVLWIVARIRSGRAMRRRQPSQSTPQRDR